jgi:hypothetical protein
LHTRYYIIRGGHPQLIFRSAVVDPAVVDYLSQADRQIGKQTGRQVADR